MLNGFKPLKLTKTNVFTYLMIITFFISSVVLIQTNSASMTNSVNSNENSLNISNYLDKLVQNSPIVNLNGQSDLKNAIFTYSTPQEKASILNYVSKYGELVNVLQYMPYILAKIPNSQFTVLKDHNINVIKDKLYQVIPQNSTIMSTSAIASTSTYPIPIDQINGRTLTQTDNLTGQGIKIAVIDSGIDFTHPDLAGKNLTSISFVTKAYGYSSAETAADYNGHGTHVAALAAGTGAASGGKYIGIAPAAKLYDFKVVDAQGSATESALLAAIDAAKKPQYGVNIITMSLGFTGSYPNDPVSLSLDNAVNVHGIVVTVSAGNSGPGNGTIATPASAQSVIAVGAAYWNDTATFFSSRGPTSDYRIDPDILAPGWFEVSALATNSLLQLSEQYYSPTEVITGNKGNYIPESGTSMAAPIVAGSVALLKQAFPSASPQAIRAALMESATNVNESENVQGSGFINLQGAYNLLKQNAATNSYNPDVIAVLPQKSIFTDNSVLYPGQQLHINFKFIAGSQTNIGVQFTNSTLQSLVTYNHSVTSLQSMQYTNYGNGYYGELLLTFKVPLNPVAGEYTGTVKITTGLKNYTLSIGPIFVKVPSREVGWNIWYQTDGLDTPTGNYASLASYLGTKNITLVPVNKPVDASWIYKYKTIVFPDNELSIPKAGLTLLKNYINSGGNVLILSSFYPFSDIGNYNALTQSYGISVLHATDMNVYDLGLQQVAVPKNESMTLHSVDNFNLIQGLDWYGGTHLSVDSSILGDHIIGTINDNQSTPVIGAFTGNKTSTGQLFVLSSEYWLYNEFFNTPEEQFATTLFNTLEDPTSPFITVISNNSTIQAGEPWNASLFVGTSSSFGNVSQAVVHLTLPNGTSVQLTPTVSAHTLGGMLSYTNTNQVGHYELTISYNSQQYNSSFLVYNTKLDFTPILYSNSKSTAPSFLQDTGIPSVAKNDNIAIGLDLNQSISNLSVSAVITLVPELLEQYSGYIPTQNALYTTEIPLQQAPKNKTLYQTTFNTANLNQIGFYIVEFVFSQTNALVPAVTQFAFFVSATNPSINLQSSTINGNTFKSYDFTSSSSQPPILTVNPGQSISFSVTADNLSGNGSVFVLFIPYYPFLDSQEVISYYEINASSSGFTGTIKMPTVTSVQSNGRTLNFGDPHLTAFLVVLRDQYGNIDAFPIFTTVKQSLPINQGLILFIFVIIPGVIVFIYYMKSRGKRKQDNYNYNFNYPQNQQNRNNYPGQPPYNQPYNQPPNQQNPNQQPPYQQPPYQQPPYQQQEEVNFCPYCGSKVLLGSNFCMECGKKIK